MEFVSIFHKVNSVYQFIDSISDTLIVLSLILLIVLIVYGKRFGTDNVNNYYREELYKTIESNIDNVFLIWDTRRKEFNYISTNFDKIFEIDRKVLDNKNNIILNRLPNEIREKVIGLYGSSFCKSNVIEEGLEYIKPITKTKCWLMIRIYPIYNHKKLVRIISVITDISKEKQTQTELEEALLKIKQANQAKKEFLSHISHELKTPVNAIMGLSTIASYRLNLYDFNVQEYLNRINFISKNLTELINNIMDVSKLDNSKLVLVHRPFNLRSLISDFSFVIKEQINQNGQEFYLTIDAVQNEIMIGDSLRLTQILTNCLSNSIKFTPLRGKISLEVSEIKKQEDDYVLFRFVISDTGKGMSEEFLKRLYEPYEQEDDTISRQYGGTGIGMTITKELVELMGGTILVTSEVNKGTIVTIHLKFQLVNDPEKMKLWNEISNLKNYDCKGKRILLVEDNEINRDVMFEILSNMNLSVETASNGYEAVKLFDASYQGYYNAILMDFNLPDLNGCMTAELIRKSAHPDAVSINIISLSADDFTEDEIDNSCFNYHIKKPMDIDFLYSLL